MWWVGLCDVLQLVVFCVWLNVMLQHRKLKVLQH